MVDNDRRRLPCLTGTPTLAPMTLVSAAVFAALLQPQTATAPREVTLGKADRVLPQEFTQIHGVRELPDGRVLVTDRLDKGVVVVDFAANTVRQVGRTGRGPAEYRLPTTLKAVPGDSTLLSDEGNSRLAIIGPDLRIHRSFTLLLPGISFPMGARGMDPQGRFYLQIPAWMDGPRRPNDSVVVVRFDPRAQRVDTLLRVQGSTALPPGPRYGMGWVVFAPQDVWSVTRDGRIAVVRSSDYHVEWYEPNGRIVRGPPVRFERLAVTWDDRIAFVRHFLENSNIGGRGAEAGLSAVPASMMEEGSIREMATKNTFAEAKAAFTDAAPLIAPEGTLWVERSRRPGEAQLWDVFDSTGALVSRVRLPAKRHLGGLGVKVLYAIATDEDGVQQLERYRRE